jgi:hypothetical protein
MDSSLTIVSLILVASVFMPFFLMNTAGKTEARKRSKLFKLAIAKYKLEISEKDSWGNSHIGIDTNKKSVLFMKMDDSVNMERYIDLNFAKDIKVISSVKTSKVGDRKQSLLLRVDVEISFQGQRPVTNLNFYDHESIYAEDYEIKRAEKWKKTMERAITCARVDQKVA